MVYSNIQRVISLVGLVFRWAFRWVLNSDWDQRSAKKWSLFFHLDWAISWLNIITIVAQSVRLLPADMPEDTHTTRQLHCHWWSGQCHAKRATNAASVHQWCAPVTLDSLLDDDPYPVVDRVEVRTVWWPHIQWNDSRHCLWKSYSVRFVKIRISDFSKVVRQHTVCMVGSIIWVLLEI